MYMIYDWYMVYYIWYMDTQIYIFICIHVYKQIPSDGYTDSEDMYSQARGGSERSSRGSQEGSSAKRSKALVDSEIQILVSAISNLKVARYTWMYICVHLCFKYFMYAFKINDNDNSDNFKR
jgi:hypothetical protein